MPTTFCSHCAAKIAYEAAKPASCPKCSKPIKDAMAILTQAISTATAGTLPPPATPHPVSTIIVGGPRTASASYDDTAVQPARSERSRPAHRPDNDDTRPPRQLDPMYPDEKPGDRSLNEDVYDRREANRLKRELMASMDLNAFSVGEEGDDDEKVTFARWVVTDKEPKAGATKRRGRKR